MLPKFESLYKNSELANPKDVSAAICEWISSEEKDSFLETRYKKDSTITGI